jgi:hypothetical protein
VLVEERIIETDPVRDPAGYQREVLALLGGQDPVAVLDGTLVTLRALTAGLDPETLARRPEPGEWSALELLGHLWDAEIAYSFRARAILAQDEPPLAGYDQDAWATLPRPPYSALLAAFAALRSSNVALIRETPTERWERRGLHSERGPTTFRVLTELTAGHDIAHQRQLEQTIAAVHPRVRRGQADST